MVLKGDPDLLQRIIDYISENSPGLYNTISDALEASISLRGVLGVTGFLGLLYTGTKVIDSLQIWLNEIWGMRKPSFLRRKAKSLLSLLVLGLVGALGVGIHITFILVSDRLRWLNAFAGILVFFLTSLIIFVALSFIYSFAVEGELAFRDVWKGALFVALLANPMQMLLIWYYTNLGDFSAIYGSFAGIVLTVIVIYYLGYIIFLGAELNHYLIAASRGEREEDVPGETPAGPVSGGGAGEAQSRQEIKEDFVDTAQDYNRYMYDLVDRAVTDIGPRESCSEEEKRLGRLFAGEVETACERVDFEEFTCAPRAFLGFFPYLVLLYLAGVVLYYIFPPVSVLLAAVGIGVLFFEVVRYRELIDPLFARRRGENVAGFVKPRGEVKKRVIVSAHLDSAYEFKVWYWLKGLSVPAMALAFLAPALLLGASLARTIADSNGVPDNAAYAALGIACIALSPLVAVFAFFHTQDVVPGAMDDMAGIAVLAGLAKYLADTGEGGGFYPENTEVVLLALSSEEAGLRGAKRFARRHKGEYADVPTYAVFLDGIYDEQFLTAFKREVWCGAKMDPYLVALARDAAGANGYGIKTAVLAVGATDASAFAREGIPSVSVCCQDSTRLVPNYHTRHDTIEFIRPESLGVSLQLVVEMIRRIDA